MSQNEIIKAWRDAEYRDSLSEGERSRLPELPVGLIELNDAELDMVAGAMRAMSCGSHHVCCTKP